MPTARLASNRGHPGALMFSVTSWNEFQAELELGTDAASQHKPCAACGSVQLPFAPDSFKAADHFCVFFSSLGRLRRRLGSHSFDSTTLGALREAAAVMRKPSLFGSPFGLRHDLAQAVRWTELSSFCAMMQAWPQQLLPPSQSRRCCEYSLYTAVRRASGP